MRYQNLVVDQTRAAAAEFFRYARAVPADKLEWSPLDAGRSVLDQCREVAICPTWADEIVKGVEFKFDEEESAENHREQSAWITIDDCEKQFETRMARYEETLMTFPDERLNETRWLPFDGGRDFTFIEMMDYPRWNCTYHLGQVGYVQTLYGDRDMH